MAALHTSAPRVLAAARSVVGEGPVWDAAAGRLRWVDIMSGRLNSTDPETGATTSQTVPTLVGAAAPRAAGGLVLATREGFGTVDGPEGPGFHPRLDVLAVGERMNDAAVDPWGRYWAGSTTMDFAPGRGALHLLEPEWTSRVMLDGLTLPNGLGWSPDRRTFYLVDTMPGDILCFDIDPDTHLPVGGRLFQHVEESRGIPDGITVDAAGCLWVALWGGAAVLVLSPEGDELGVLEVPVRQPSSCTFGGQGLGRLFVTSARDGLDVADDAPDGSLFVVDSPGVTGQPATPFAG
jgi:sugar lactone lactonase YvrE